MDWSRRLDAPATGRLARRHNKSQRQPIRPVHVPVTRDRKRCRVSGQSLDHCHELLHLCDIQVLRGKWSWCTTPLAAHMKSDGLSREDAARRDG